MSSSNLSTSSAASMNQQVRRPRPRSPPSMYLAYDSNMAKAPKPLVKIEKKSKGKGKAKADPEPPRPATAMSQGRPSTGGFLSLRRKTNPESSTRRAELSQTPSPAPLTPSSHLHETNVHPLDDWDPEPILSRPGPSKASRLLGTASASTTADGPSRPAAINVITSDLSAYASRRRNAVGVSSSTLDVSSSSSSLDDDDDASSLSSYSYSYSHEFDAHADDAHLDSARESMLISPMEFSSRPASLPFPPPPPEPLEDEAVADDEHIDSDSLLISPMEFPSRPASLAPSVQQPPSHAAAVAADDSHSDDDSNPGTPVFSRPPRTLPDADEEFRLSYASVHNYYRTTTPAPVLAPAEEGDEDEDSRVDKPPVAPYRPDSPFMDTLLAVNSRSISQILVSRTGSRRGTHGRQPSVVRVEPNSKELGAGWVGEWNQGDMNDVMQRLRALR
ncbi:hypothetical protein FB45DRAFT_862187 [Roridomyces roridus]|uniref:Uncharacterized protein n=1 Tax=Roridomyces roridus TaxID=1738132 RepID=A0AAD7CCR8_9AGAR|nr:hypothetical protein FB45DRAFT_862187 [Roridomyces roridus]